MKLKITERDWDAIFALIDTISQWSDNFNGDYKKDYDHFNAKTVERVNRQLRTKVPRRKSILGHPRKPRAY